MYTQDQWSATVRGRLARPGIPGSGPGTWLDFENFRAGLKNAELSKPGFENYPAGLPGQGPTLLRTKKNRTQG